MKEEMKKCVFCEKLKGLKIRTAFFEPLNPVVKGHMLAVPKKHLTDFAHSPVDTANVMKDASAYIKRKGGEWNIITSIGKNATQSVFHFHIHLVPRKENDGLHLPWTNQRPLKSNPNEKHG